MRDTHQVLAEFRRLAEVILSEQGDAACQEVILEPSLERSLERDQADEGKRREQDEAEGIEGRPDACGGCNQTERDQAAGGRREEHRCSSRRLGDRGRTSALEREV